MTKVKTMTNILLNQGSRFIINLLILLFFKKISLFHFTFRLIDKFKENKQRF